MSPHATAIDTDALAPESLDLYRRLHSDDATVRRVALLAFVDVEDEALLPAITTLLLNDGEAALRAEAARVLAGWDDAGVVDALAQALCDETEVRLAAAQALTELKDPASGERLVPWARHADALVRGAALRALRELRVPAAAAPAIESVDHADAAVRREAVGVLAWLKWAEALPLLAIRAAEDTDAEVRRAATGALGLAPAGSEEVVLPALCTALLDSAWAVREEAATVLGKVAGAAQTARAALRQAMADDYWQVRLRAARSLGKLYDAAALPLLIEALAHPAGNLRKESAIALGEIGDPRAKPALEVAEADPDPEVRKVARLGLARLAQAPSALWLP